MITLTRLILHRDRLAFALFIIPLLCLAFMLSCDRSIEAQHLPLAPEFRVGPSSACGSTSPGSQTASFTVNGATRNYRVDVPSWWDRETPIPIVYTWHSCGGNEQNGTWNSLYFRTAQAQWLGPGLTPYDAIVVMGDAASTCWDIEPSTADYAYAEALRTEIETHYCVDTERRYHAGASSGAFAAQAYACRLGGVAGVYAAHGGIHIPVSVNGLAVSPLPDECEPTPVYLMNSTTDTTVPIGTYGYAARDVWLEQNGCDPESAVPYSLPIPAAGVGGTSCGALPNCTCVSYSCLDAPVVWCEHSGTHTQWGYYRDVAANFFAPLTKVPQAGGTSSGGVETGSSSGGLTTEPASSTTACECVCP